MKNVLLLCAGIVVCAVAHADERPAIYPFDVTLGGVKAEVKPGNQLFAEVPKPVTDNAVLALDHEVPMLIVNAFPCKEDGSVEETQAAAILYAQKVKEVKLDATMDKKKLAPGTYLANVVADGKTSRIVFTVAPAESKVKADFSKVLGFLKKKAGIE
ncbi:hypothetical protein [Luteolibacter sp. LG18]|uniref:hypothetical protein n=1 Tax=Luteolibacter sp. LG18 TaxID=2819286 RepID=UPI002B2B6D74|nr:hypothetical protein llg_11590 [Luteolibacter sp. LG18]